MSRYSVAKEISTELNTKWEVTWITPWVVQIFIVLSLPVRRFLVSTLRSQRALFLLKKQDVVLQTRKGDSLANQLFSLRAAASLALQPVSDVLRVFPLDTILKEIPDANQFIGNLTTDVTDISKVSINSALDYLSKLSPEIAKFLSESISFTPISINSSFEGFDAFDGVDSFQDLQDKIDELLFRTSRAVALSTYANSTSSYIDMLLKKFDIYIDIIETLDLRNL
jgi:hypothetical protein